MIMHVELACQPAYTLAYLHLSAGEEAWCEPGSMVAMSMGIEMSARVDGNPVKAALRNFIAGESFFLSRIRGQVAGAWVAISPKFPGDVAAVEIFPGDPLMVQSGSYLAHGSGVDVGVKLAGAGEFLLQEGSVLLSISGKGTAVIASYGGMQSIDLNIGDSVVIDTAHLVAWSTSLILKVGPLNGVFTSAAGGEGLAGQFTAKNAPGRVIIQTRAESQIKSWFQPDREMNKR
jgi:uncharacterized protein (TIGR00266 family)